jgi:F-box/leucine-rich repeat protein 2/20
MQGRRPSVESIRPLPKLRYAKEKGGSEGELETSYISDAGLTVLGEGFSKLEKLSLIWCNNVSSMGLVSVAQKCRFLKSLDLQVNLQLVER